MLKLSIAFIATIFLFTGCTNKNLELTHNLEKKRGNLFYKTSKKY